MKIILSFFLIFYAFSTIFEPSHAQVQDNGYLGCYKEDPLNRQFATSPGNYDPDDLKINICRSRCGEWRYQYAALTSSKVCFCSNYLTLTNVSDTLCTLPCSGNASEICGDWDHISVYVAPLPIDDFETILKSNQIVQVWDTVEFGVEISGGPIEVVYRMNYGDGSGFTKPNVTDMFKKRFGLPGEYTVIGEVADVFELLPKKQDALTILVQAPVQLVKLSCPLTTITHTEFRCNASVLSGSFLNVKVDWEDGVVENFPIADAIWHAAGPPILQHSPIQDISTSTRIYVQPNSQFEDDGVLLAFEFWATQTGYIELYLFRPNCEQNGEYYCWKSNKCSSINTCSDPKTTTCSSGQQFCPVSSVCLASEGDACPSASNRYTSGSAVRYELIKKWGHTISAVGHNVKSILEDEEINVEAGDVIGFNTVGNGRIGGRDVFANEIEDKYWTGISSINVGQMIPSTSQQGIGKRHLLRATATKPVNILLYHSYTISKEYHININVSNEFINGFGTNSTNIFAQLGIDKAILIYPKIVAIGDLITFTVLPHDGTDVSYKWNFGDSATVLETVAPTNTHTFNGRGSYNISIEAFNKLSSKSNVTEIFVQERIENLRITTDLGEVGAVHKFYLNMTKGTDYVCNWSFGDGSNNVSDWKNTPKSGGFMEHVYNEEREYDVNVTCWNDVSRDEDNIKVKTYVRLVNVRVDPKGTIKGESFRFTILYDNGSLPTSTLTYDSKDIVMTLDQSKKQFLSQFQPASLNIGKHSLKAIVWNPISQVIININFTVEERITSFYAKMNPTELEIKLDDEIDFTAGMLSGTSVKLLFDYKDGRNDTFQMPDLVGWTPGVEKTYRHKFDIPGNFLVTISASNFETFTQTFQISVYNKIEGLKLTSNSPASFVEPEGIVWFWFEIEKYAPTNGQIRFIDYGDNSPVSGNFQPFTMDRKTFWHAYKKSGTYNVKVIVRNKINELTLSHTVKLQIPITNMIVDVFPLHAPINLPVKVGVRMDSGVDVKLTWEWGDGELSTEKMRLGITPGDVDSESHIFAVVGTYKMTITASNDLGNTSIDYVIVAQHPVNQFFKFESNAPIIYPPGKVEFTLSYAPEQILPTDAFYVIEFGDGNSLKADKLIFKTSSRTMKFIHEYDKPSDWIATAKIYNLASSKSIQASGGVFEKIGNLKGKPMFQPELPVDGPDQEGFGKDKNIFPLNREVKFLMTQVGTVVKYLVTVKSDSAIQICNKTTSPVQIGFPMVGEYDVKIQAWNPISLETYDTKIIIANGITDLDVGDGMIRTKSGQKKEFTAKFGTIGTNTCLKVDFGDGTTPIAYGLEADCQLYFQMKSSGEVKETMKLSHVYNKNTFFTLKLTAKSLLNEEERTFSFTVSASNCAAPLVQIQDSVKKFSKARKVYRKESFRLVGLTSIQCSETLKNLKSWLIEEIDDKTGDVLKVIDISLLRSRSTAELNIPSSFLEYGLYKATYTVQMDSKGISDKSAFNSSATTYVLIRASPLIVQVMEGGMNVITRGFKRDIELDAGRNSIDPDNPKSKDFNKFEWWCKRTDGEWPIDENGGMAHTPVVWPLSVDELKSSTDKTDRRGCFVYQPPGKLNTSEGKITFNTGNMLENETYVFYVKVYKGARTAGSYLQLQVVTGDPPNVLLKCAFGGLCTPTSTGQRLNPTERLALKGTCTNCPKSQLYTYEWLLFRKGLNNAWIEIHDFGFFTNGTSGLSSSEISIQSALFLKYLQTQVKVLEYRVKLSLIPIGGGTVGISYTNLIINAPPARGSCSISPLDGVILKDVFHVNCTNWYDADGISSYQIISRIKNSDIENTLYIGNADSLIPVNIPLGPDFDNYKVDIYVRIADNFGATTIKKINTVKVKPLDSSKLKEEIIKNENEIKKLAANGDLTESSAFYLKYANALNQDNSNDEKYYANLGVDTFPVSTPFGDINLHKRPIVKKNLSPEESAKLDELSEKKSLERNSRSELREIMMESMANMPADTIKALQLKATTLREITKSNGELNRNSQKKLIENLQSAVKALDGLADESPKTELLLCVKQLLSSCADGMEAFGTHINYPLDKDVIESMDSVFYEYDTNVYKKRKRLDGISEEESQGLFRLETNSLNQKQVAGEYESQTRPVVNQLVEIINRRVVLGEEPTIIKTDKLIAQIEKNNAKKLLTKDIESGRCKTKFPNNWCDLLSNSNCDSNQAISVRSVSYSFNPLTHVKNNDYVPSMINTMELSFFDDDSKSILITNSSKPIEIEMDIDPVIEIDEANLINATMPDNTAFFMHNFPVNLTQSAITIEIEPLDKKAQYLALLRYGNLPDLAKEKEDFDYHFMFPRKMSDAVKNYKVILDGSLIGDRIGMWYIGLRQLNKSEHDKYTELARPQVPYVNGSGEFSSNYTFRVFATSCSYFDELSKIWKSNGLNAQQSGDRRVKCNSNHLTLFGGSMTVQPNTIDWSYVAKNLSFSDNPTLYITEIVIAIVYILLAIWARRQDKKDVMKLGVTPLPDNVVGHNYFYQIITYTGMRKNAGTDSKVQFILSGEKDETDVRALEDKERKVFRRGGVDAFLLATESPLGQLSYMRVWHDNSGKGKYASWFLKYIIIVDLQTREKSYFINNRWLAVEEDDGQVDRLIAVAGKDQMEQFDHLFAANTKKKLGDGHLWFSVLARPPQSRFTRLQRVSCCLLLLYTSMLANAMFYGRGESKGGSQNAVQLGPFALSPAQVYIGIVSNLIVFPINLLVVTLFRKSKKKRKRASRLQEALKKNERTANKRASFSSLGGGGGGWNENKRNSLQDDLSQPDTERTCSPGCSSTTKMIKAERTKKKKPFALPWWFKIVSWILLWISIFASAAVVTAYGITFGDLKSKEWITSMLISFVMSVFLTQPVKVILVAILVSLIFKDTNIDEEEGDDDEEDYVLQNDEQWLHNPIDATTNAKRRKIPYKPPDSEALEKARIERLKELEMYNVLREIAFYAIFLWLLIMIGYNYRNANSGTMKQSMVNHFIDVAKKNDRLADFRDIHNKSHLFYWLENSFAPSLRAGNWYNGQKPFGQVGFAADRVSRFMGYATLRQLRVKPNLCRIVASMRPIMKECNPGYGIFKEEKGSFDMGWKEFNTSTQQQQLPLSHYVYRTAEELDGYPYWALDAVYSGGGYVVGLNTSLSDIISKIRQLKDEMWIDGRSRALFIEFTVYNPGINLFGICALVAEFIPTGGVITSQRIEAINLLSYSSGAVILQLITELLYLLFILFFIVKEARNMYRQRKEYFKDLWNWLELCIIVFSISGTVMYFYKLLQTNILLKKFKETHGNGYMKFQYVAYWHEMLMYMVGWCVFLATLKFIRLLRFNKRMSMLGATLKVAGSSLAQFGILFTIMFFAFVQFFFFIYSQVMLTFSSILIAIETCFQMLLGRFNFEEMQSSSPLLGPIFFFLYVITIAYIMINMFLVILNESFSQVRADISKQSNDYELVEFMIRRLKTWTGIGKKKPQPVYVPQAEITPADIEHFPERVDRLLNCISKVYFDNNQIEDIFEKHGLNKGLLKNDDKESMKSLMHGGRADGDVSERMKKSMEMAARNIKLQHFTTVQDAGNATSNI